MKVQWYKQYIIIVDKYVLVININHIHKTWYTDQSSKTMLKQELKHQLQWWYNSSHDFKYVFIQ